MAEVKLDITSVPKLTGPNYRIWHARFKAAVDAIKGWDYLTKDHIPVGANDAEKAANAKAHEEAGARASAALMSTISDDVLDLVATKSTGRERYRAIEDLFKNYAATNHQQLLKQWDSLGEMKNKTAAETAMEVMKAASVIEAANVAMKRTEQDKLQKLLRCLPDEDYRDFKNSYIFEFRKCYFAVNVQEFLRKNQLFLLFFLFLVFHFLFFIFCFSKNTKVTLIV